MRKVNHDDLFLLIFDRIIQKTRLLFLGGIFSLQIPFCSDLKIRVSKAKIFLSHQKVGLKISCCKFQIWTERYR